MEEKDSQDQRAFEDFEHLSQFDLDYEFLQSENSFSIIDSVMTGNQSYGVKSMVSAGGQSSTSEFSIVGSQRSMSIFSGKTTKSIHQIEPIETKKDIYVEDVI